jgi:23S rRNA (cytidine2498-2'-O)-methyltransferase
MNVSNKSIPSGQLAHNASILQRMQSLSPPTQSQHQNWMLQVTQHAVKVWESDFLHELDLNPHLTHLGRDFYELKTTSQLNHKQLLDTGLPRWICPIEHRWPAHPDAKDFVERAAQGLMKKFGDAATSIVVVSPTPELRSVASHVRARLNQLSTDLGAQFSNADRTSGATLNALIHRKGVIAGLSNNKIETGSPFDAGLGFLSPKQEESKVSRAAGKISEVLSLLKIANVDCVDLNHWLELGAAPGGMTQALVEAGASVTAVDLADMKPNLLQHPKVQHLKIHADAIQSASQYSALLSDMNGPTELAASIVSRLIKTMSVGAVVVHTLKVQDFKNMRSAIRMATSSFERSGAQVILIRHLFHNRKELTIVAVRR